MLILGVITTWIICAFVGAKLAGEKGRSTTGFWLGLLFGPIGIIIALLLSPIGSLAASQADSEELNDLNALVKNKGKTGIVLSVSDGRTILSVIDGSIAEASGIRANDRIITIDGCLINGDYRDNALKLVGEAGTAVSITVRRGETAHDFTLIRI